MIRFGMALMEMVEQLTKGFVKATGRQPDNLEKLKIQQEAVQRFKDMNKVVDMEGNVIDTSKGIMGGRQIQENKELSQAIKEELMKKDNPYSDLVKTTEKGPKSLEQRRKEAEEALKNKNVVPIKDPEDMATGGRAGFKAGLGKSFLELLKNKKMFRSKDDVPTSIFSEKKGPITIEDMANIPEDQLRKIRRTQELGLYTETPEILKAGNLFERFTKKVGSKRVIDYDRAEVILNRKLRGDETLNELLQIEYQTRPGRADGGRAGFKLGSIDKARRAFLKAAAGIGGGVAALKTGLLGLAKQPAKQVTEEVVKSAGSGTPPPYFFKLVEKIKKMGDDVTAKNATTERQQIHRYKDYELTEDLTSGEQTIQRIKTDGPEYYDEQLAEEIYMNYKPGAGQSDEAGRVADEYIEDTGYLRTSGPEKGELFDTADGLTEDSLKEIMEEVSEEVVKIKKASGGIARMLGE